MDILKTFFSAETKFVVPTHVHESVIVLWPDG